MSNREAKNVIIDGKSIGAICEQESDQVYLGIQVSRARAEYLVQCLERPLCLGCGREEDECQADPCTDELIKRGGLQVCSGCTLTFHQNQLTDGKCPNCRDQLPVFEVTVYETITYSAHVEAESQEQAERAIDNIAAEDWEPVRESAQFDKYGYEVNKRKWDIFKVERSDFIAKLAENDLLISAPEWDELDKS